MNGWVKADVHYGLPMARLYVTAEQYRGGSVAEGIHRVLESKADDPAATEEFFASVLRLYRPKLVGGSLLAVRFDFERACWEFLYVHPSLPRKATGDVTERMPLVPGKDGDRPARASLDSTIGGILAARTAEELAAVIADDDDSWLDDLPEKDTPPGPRAEFEKVTDDILAGLKADHRREVIESADRVMDQLIDPKPAKMWSPTRPITVDATLKAGLALGTTYPPGLIESATKDATGLPVKFGRTGVTVGHVSSVDATGRATISFKEGCEVLAEWAQRGMLEPITGESMTADAVTIEAQPATRRQEKGRMVHSQPNGWQIKVDRTQTPRSGRLTSPVLVGASATVGDFTGPLVAYDAQYDTWYEVGEAIVAAIRTGPDGSMDVEADTFGEFHSTLSPESAASARAAGMQAGLAHEQRVMDAFLAATAEGIGDVLVSDRGMVCLPPADPDAPHVVTGGES